VNLEVTGASRSAIASVEKTGGTVKVLKSAMTD
jgi:ribosomal protein L15